MTWTQQDSSPTAAENPIDIANLLNRYFYSVFKPCDAAHHSPLPADDDSINVITISDLELAEGEVCCVLKTRDVDKATGPDKISVVLLKTCAANISPSLCELFNKSLCCGKLPLEWKLSNISPIPKKSPFHEVSNHRPISLLSLVFKVFERRIYNKIIDHLSSKLCDLQCGFQSGKSTTAQMLYVLHEIHNVLEKRGQVDTVYLNFAKAFDKVSHHLLLVKLHNFGIRGDLR
jgi:hypothetical protein